MQSKGIESLNELWGGGFEGKVQPTKLSQAYLLVGEEAPLVARKLILKINCEQGCGKCPTCRKIKRGVHPDVRWVAKTRKRIGIDQVRELRKDALYPPSEAKWKIYLIDGVEEMSIEAANSLLGILESPPPYLIFLLLARSLNLLPTIVSRCQVIRLTEVTQDSIKKELGLRGFDAEEIDYLLAVTKGMPCLLAGLPLERGYKPLDKLERIGKRLKSAADQELVGLLAGAVDLIEERETTLEILNRLPNWSSYKILSIAGALSKLERVKLEGFLREVIFWYRDMLMIRFAKVQSTRSIFNLDRETLLKERGTRFSFTELLSLIHRLEILRQELQGNANLQLLLESALFRMRRADKEGPN